MKASISSGSKTGAGVGRKRRRWLGRDTIFAVGLLLPALLILGAVIFVPIGKGILMSFQDYRLATRNDPPFVGFDNYVKLFQSGDIYTYFLNTFIFVGGVVGSQFLLAMGIALLLNRPIKGRNIYRGLFLIPWTIPSVIVALLWSWLFQPQYGVVNWLLSSVGAIQLGTDWLQNTTLAMPAIIIAVAWRQFPIMVVMFLAGLQTVPQDLQEAAMIDGGSRWQILRYVTLPYMRPVIDTTIVIAIVNNFQMFTIIYNMTAGGPIDRTTTLSIGAYNSAFTRFEFGVGAAVGVLWLIVLVGLVAIYNWRAERARLD